ncbi:hypothetical protein H632_c5608p0, partial [Helicosporidium sp. ATCC 50920]
RALPAGRGPRPRGRRERHGAPVRGLPGHDGRRRQGPDLFGPGARPLRRAGLRGPLQRRHGAPEPRGLCHARRRQGGKERRQRPRRGGSGLELGGKEARGRSGSQGQLRGCLPGALASGADSRQARRRLPRGTRGRGGQGRRREEGGKRGRGRDRRPRCHETRHGPRDSRLAG